jgi:pimeloyl-ACP methyl ester carboxylesterase
MKDLAEITTHFVQTPSGRISYSQAGSGPVALFVHGVLLNKYFWRHQMVDLADIRRVIAVDLLAHGDTDIAPGQDVSVTANANMLREFLEALKIDKVDLIGNESGGGISQIFAAKNPERVRTLTLTECDVDNTWPPSEASNPFVEMTKAGGLKDTLSALINDKSGYRSPDGFGSAYERPDKVTDGDIDTYLRPHLRSEQRTRDLERFVVALDNKHMIEIECQLRQLRAPTLIVWGADDIYFPINWAYWLAAIIPSAKEPVVLDGARLFFPEERPETFNRLLRAHFAT